MQLRHFLRAALLCGTAAGALAVAACSDPFQPIAQLDTAADAFLLYSLSGASPQLPSGLELTLPSAVRPTVSTQIVPGVGPITRATFDLAFNVEADGRVRLYTPATLLARTVASRRVGLRRVAAPFDSIRSAPTGGFAYDSSLVVSVGESVVVETVAGCSSISTPLTAKLVVDSVNAAARTLFVRVRSNPNCGFRSLLPGRPKT